jgi:DNA-binding transcriptional MocR family regulator
LITALKQYPIEAANAAQLVQSVERALAGGALLPGERLPSVRRLAVQLRLSPATVAAGLAELRRRGVVVTEQRRGTRIAGLPPGGSTRIPLPVPPGARELSRGNPDPALLPELAPVLARLKPPPRLYGEAPVVPELAELARAQMRAEGVPAEALCVVSGALDGIERALAAHLRPGDRVAVENPGYAALFDLLRARGLHLEAVAIDERGMLPDALYDALRHGARAAVITPRGQNPTGAALDARRAGELRTALARFPETLLIEDDHLGQVAGCPLHTAVVGLKRWVATRSVAKALGPDLRLAVLAGDAETVARVQGSQQCGPGWVSHILQRTVLELWSDPLVGASVEHASAVYAERREHLLSCLRRRGVGAQGSSGLNVWVPVADETGAVAALLQHGWVLAPGRPFRLQGSAPALRITVAALSAHDSELLADDLARTLLAAPSPRSG